ncbi:hypothetical protein RI054_37g139290 [Pseudoscourfieldia marina]
MSDDAGAVTTVPVKGKLKFAHLVTILRIVNHVATSEVASTHQGIKYIIMSELSCANNCLNRDEYLKSQNVAVLFAQHKAKALEDKAKALEADVTKAN